MPDEAPRGYLRYAAYAAAGAAWLSIAYVALHGDGNPNASCSASVYRDPVTGRAAAMGDVRTTPEGRVLCPRRVPVAEAPSP